MSGFLFKPVFLFPSVCLLNLIFHSFPHLGKNENSVILMIKKKNQETWRKTKVEVLSRVSQCIIKSCKNKQQRGKINVTVKYWRSGC